MPTQLQLSRAPLALALTALALAACGEPADHTGPTLSRLTLQSAGQAPAPTLEVIQDFVLPARGLPDWRITSEHLEAELQILSAEDTRYLELPASGPVQVTLTLDCEPTQFNQVAVSVVPVQARLLDLSPGGPESDESATPAQHLRPRRKPVTILFDLHDTTWSAEDPRTLTLSFRPPAGAAHAQGPGAGRGLGLVSVALLKRPLGLWLPRPSEGPELIILGEEARRGVGLVAGQALESHFEAGDWRELSLAHGVPPVAQAAHTAEDVPLALALRVTLTDAEGTTRVEHLPSTDRWKTEHLSLRGLAGAVSVRLETEMEGGGAGLLAVGELRLEHGRSSAPAVLLITSDTHRADHVAVMDLGVDVRTPTLDRLAQRGVLYTDCVTSANLTHPSHVALMSGHAPRDTGIVNNTELVSDEPVLLAERFGDAGWTTYAAVSVGSLDHPRSGLGQGFDRVFAPTFGIRDSAQTIEDLLAALPDAEGQPLFVWLHLFDAHTPYRVHPEYQDLYYPPDRDPRDPSLPELDPWQGAHGKPGVRDLEYPVALYRAEVSYLDAQLERLFGHARFERDIIAFTSDHGESLTAHNVWFSHEELYPQTLHVPLIMVWPDGPSGMRVTRPVQQIDVGHTLLELSGVGAGDFAGRDLTLDEVASRPRFALGSGAVSASVYADSWFLMLRLRRFQVSDRSQPPAPAHVIELYDLAQDPTCEHELSEQQPEVAAKLRRLLIAWLIDAPETGWNAPQSFAGADDLQQLADLGYTTSMRSSTSTQWFDPECDCDECARWE